MKQRKGLCRELAIYQFPYFCHQKKMKAAPDGQESSDRLQVWSGLRSFDCICLYLTLLPQAGRRLELCWHTSREFHPSEELSELQYRSIMVG